jgi:hypothetical protein
MALIFCFIIIPFAIGGTIKKDEKTDDDNDAGVSGSCNRYIGNGKIGRSSIVFIGISKRHEHGLH